jgi:ribosomal RNA-processing protein 12
MPEVLKAVLSSTPTKSDKALAPGWLQVLGHTMLAYSATDPEGCAVEVGNVWKIIWSYLESTDPSTRKAASESLDLLSQCITPVLIESTIKEDVRDEPKSVLGKIIAQVMNALGSLAYARSISEVLSATSSLIANLRYRRGSRKSPTAAEILMSPLIRKIGDLRVQKGFEDKEGADVVLATAMRVVGPEVLLRVLPLNLEPADR